MLSFIHAFLEFFFNLYSCWANEKLQRIYHSYEKYRYKVNVFFWIWLWNKQSCNWVSFHFIRHHSIWLWFIFEKKLNSQWLNMIPWKIWMTSLSLKTILCESMEHIHFVSKSWNLHFAWSDMNWHSDIFHHKNQTSAWMFDTEQDIRG